VPEAFRSVLNLQTGQNSLKICADVAVISSANCDREVCIWPAE